MWPQASKLKRGIREGKFEPSEAVKAHLEKARVGFSDQLTSDLWSQVEKRIEAKEEKQEDVTATPEKAEEKQSFLAWLLKDSGPHL